MSHTPDSISATLKIQKDDLVEISYVSEATQQMGVLALMNLLDTASNRNQDHQVTGVLFFDNGIFGQIIEGRACFLLPIWESIMRDPRHRNIQVLDTRKIAERRFGNWSMAFYGSEEIGKYVPELKTIFKGTIHTLPNELLNILKSISEETILARK